MKCNGLYDCCGDRCPECNRFMDDCDGNDDYSYNDNEEWVEFDEKDNEVKK